MSNDEGCHGAQWDELGGSPSLGLAHSSSTTDRLALSPPGSRPETSPRGSSDSNPTQKTATATFQDGRALVSERHPVVPAPPLTTPRSPSLAPLPPPPVPLPSSYSHPSLPPTPRRRPLPAPPSTSPRFVPLHPPPLPPPVPSTRRATGGPHDTIPQPLTAAEEKAAARARAQGLDELFAARSDADRAVVKAAADDRDEAADAAASPTSPAGTDLPEYPASPTRRGPSGSAGKRALLRDGGAVDPRQEEEGDAKRAQAEAEVRERVLSDARRTVEEDAAACKVALRRRAAEADEEERERERRRWECEGEKRLEGLRLDADEGGEEELEEDEEEAPPPLSPATLARGRDMFPLVGEDSKALPPSLTDVDERENEPPAAPPSSQPNRLPPPPVPLPEPAYPLSPATPSTRESVALPPPVDDYFFRPHPSRPSFDAHAFSEPLPPLRAQAPWPRRVPTARSATLAPSTSARSHLYAGAVATGEQGYPSSSSHSHGSVRPPAGTRHGSLGPAHSFYSSGVGQVVRVRVCLSENTGLRLTRVKRRRTAPWHSQRVGRPRTLPLQRGRTGSHPTSALQDHRASRLPGNSRTSRGRERRARVGATREPDTSRLAPWRRLRLRGTRARRPRRIHRTRLAPLCLRRSALCLPP
ncbi:hypothetical protein DMC30DRAFT_213174 [Rhodotorula diobovata]|uniref:Uncharacterized protein n=1 Tax=Rhodotorula diobovata TaxID=5288 RepID=A0A5C5G683_9BASI|nr:hypothetical protein DMC30DRAFT_213174 [Rhodotorula diobovata]